MVTRLGNYLLYDNFGMGCASREENVSSAMGVETDEVMLTFKDHDNDEIHLFKVKIPQWDQFKRLVDQTAAGQKIEIATAMPKGPQSA